MQASNLFSSKKRANWQAESSLGIEIHRLCYEDTVRWSWERLLLCKPIKASTLIHISNELTRSSAVGSGLLDHQCLQPPNCHLTWHCLAGRGLTISSWVWKRWKPWKKTGYKLWSETRQDPFQRASLTHSVMGIYRLKLNIKGAFGSYEWPDFIFMHHINFSVVEDIFHVFEYKKGKENINNKVSVKL